MPGSSPKQPWLVGFATRPQSHCQFQMAVCQPALLKPCNGSVNLGAFSISDGRVNPSHSPIPRQSVSPLYQSRLQAASLKHDSASALADCVLRSQPSNPALLQTGSNTLKSTRQSYHPSGWFGTRLLDRSPDVLCGRRTHRKHFAGGRAGLGFTAQPRVE